MSGVCLQSYCNTYLLMVLDEAICGVAVAQRLAHREFVSVHHFEEGLQIHALLE